MRARESFRISVILYEPIVDVGARQGCLNGLK